MCDGLRMICLVMLAGIVGCSRSSQPASPPGPPEPQWVVTWATAPQAALPGTPETFESQQLRLIVHTSIGGTQARIRLSNLHGTAPLEIGAARIAARVKDADIDSAGERSMTFVGQPGVTVAPGAAATSDAAHFNVPAFSDLAITLFVRGKIAATTSHLLALQTSYVSAAGVTADSPFVAASNVDTWPFLVGVDVVSAGASTVVVFGDSIVDGDGTSVGANQRWPDLLARRLDESAPGKSGIANLGLIGNRLLSASPGAGSDFGAALGAAGLERFERDALSQPGVACVIVRLGVNDLGFPGSFAPQDPPVAAQQLIDGFTKLARAARARGVRVVVTTIAPFEGTSLIAGYHTPAKDAERRAVNEWLRSTPEFDAVIDADFVLRDPAHPARLLASADSGDHLHPGDGGNAAVAAVTPSGVCRAPSPG
jgi:lysophospholipase L1-like esterase